MQDYIRGIARLFRSKIVVNSIEIAIHKLAINSIKGKSPEHVDEDNPFLSLTSLSPREYDSFQYVTDISYLVYATTMLDAFIHDSTNFLHMLHPKSIGPDQPLVLEDVLSAVSRSEIITNLACKKARDSSFQSFKDRVHYLRKKFDLALTLDDDTRKQIEHFSGIRNVIVHSQSSHSLAFDDKNGIIAKQISCPLHPTPLSEETFRMANRAYLTLAAEIFRVVTDQVLHASEEKSVLEILELVAHLIMSTYPHNVPIDNMSPEGVQKIKSEIEDTRLINKIAERGRQLACAAFSRHLQEHTQQTQQSPAGDVLKVAPEE
jgi:hypothetical protein